MGCSKIGAWNRTEDPIDEQTPTLRTELTLKGFLWSSSLQYVQPISRPKPPSEFEHMDHSNSIK